MFKRWLVYIGCLVLAGAGSPVAAQATGEYAADLGTLYGERYSLQVQKDVCIGVQPKTRRELQKAYDDWMERHEDLIEDLDARFSAMIKRVSADQKDYSRNYGKYQGAVMRLRQEQKDDLLALPREELLKQCKALPGHLRSTQSDIPVKYPDEFKTVYGKK